MYYFGRLPAYPERTHPRLHLGPYLRVSAVAPAQVDWYSAVPEWPMYLNDQIGDCTEAMVGHIIESTSLYGSGAAAVIATADVLTAYERVSGYNPDDPSTDQGAVLQDVFGDWRKTGVGGHKALVFAKIDRVREIDVRIAVANLGSVGLGIVVTEDMMADFQNGNPWSRSTGEELGGHAVPIVGYDAENVYVVTWGKVHPMTWTCYQDVTEEAWVAILPEWFDTDGQDPVGIDLYGLGREFATLTGEPNPFPQPTPGPPKPGPTDRDLLLELAVLIRNIEDAMEGGFNVIKDWLRKHGL